MVTIKISGKLDDVRETMETLRGVLKVVTISGTYQNRKEEGVRIYMQTFTSSDEKTRFMTKSKRTKFTPPPGKYPANWEELYNKWRAKEILKKTLREMTGLSMPALNRMIWDWEEEQTQKQEKE